MMQFFDDEELERNAGHYLSLGLQEINRTIAILQKGQDAPEEKSARWGELVLENENLRLQLKKEAEATDSLRFQLAGAEKKNREEGTTTVSGKMYTTLLSRCERAEKRVEEIESKLAASAKMERGKRKAEAMKDVPGYDPGYEKQIIELQQRIDQLTREGRHTGDEQALSDLTKMCEERGERIKVIEKELKGTKKFSSEQAKGFGRVIEKAIDHSSGGGLAPDLKDLGYVQVPDGPPVPKAVAEMDEKRLLKKKKEAEARTVIPAKCFSSPVVAPAKPEEKVSCPKCSGQMFNAGGKMWMCDCGHRYRKVR